MLLMNPALTGQYELKRCLAPTFVFVSNVYVLSVNYVGGNLKRSKTETVDIIFISQNVLIILIYMRF